MTQHCGFFYLQKRYICCFSGLMINRNKTEILWIGKVLHRKDTVENIKHVVRGKIIWKAFFPVFFFDFAARKNLHGYVGFMSCVF